MDRMDINDDDYETARYDAGDVLQGIQALVAAGEAIGTPEARDESIRRACMLLCDGPDWQIYVDYFEGIGAQGDAQAADGSLNGPSTATDALSVSQPGMACPSATPPLHPPSAALAPLHLSSAAAAADTTTTQTQPSCCAQLSTQHATSIMPQLARPGPLLLEKRQLALKRLKAMAELVNHEPYRPAEAALTQAIAHQRISEGLWRNDFVDEEDVTSRDVWVATAAAVESVLHEWQLSRLWEPRVQHAVGGKGACVGLDQLKTGDDRQASGDNQQAPGDHQQGSCGQVSSGCLAVLLQVVPQALQAIRCRASTLTPYEESWRPFVTTAARDTADVDRLVAEAELLKSADQVARDDRQAAEVAAARLELHQTARDLADDADDAVAEQLRAEGRAEAFGRFGGGWSECDHLPPPLPRRIARAVAELAADKLSLEQLPFRAVDRAVLEGYLAKSLQGIAVVSAPVPARRFFEVVEDALHELLGAAVGVEACVGLPQGKADELLVTTHTLLGWVERIVAALRPVLAGMAPLQLIHAEMRRGLVFIRPAAYLSFYASQRWDGYKLDGPEHLVWIPAPHWIDESLIPLLSSVLDAGTTATVVYCLLHNHLCKLAKGIPVPLTFDAACFFLRVVRWTIQDVFEVQTACTLERLFPDYSGSVPPYKAEWVSWRGYMERHLVTNCVQQVREDVYRSWGWSLRPDALVAAMSSAFDRASFELSLAGPAEPATNPSKRNPTSTAKARPVKDASRPGSSSKGKASPRQDATQPNSRKPAAPAKQQGPKPKARPAHDSSPPQPCSQAGKAGKPARKQPPATMVAGQAPAASAEAALTTPTPASTCEPSATGTAVACLHSAVSSTGPAGTAACMADQAATNEVAAAAIPINTMAAKPAAHAGLCTTALPGTADRPAAATSARQRKSSKKRAAAAGQSHPPQVAHDGCPPVLDPTSDLMHTPRPAAAASGAEASAQDMPDLIRLQVTPPPHHPSPHPMTSTMAKVAWVEPAAAQQHPESRPQQCQAGGSATVLDPQQPHLPATMHHSAPEEGDEEDEDLQDMYCPITMNLMEDPVVASDGHSYERRAIEEWLSRKDISPLTGAPLPSKQLLPNNTLHKVIQSWVALRARQAVMQQ